MCSIWTGLNGPMSGVLVGGHSHFLVQICPHIGSSIVFGRLEEIKVNTTVIEAFRLTLFPRPSSHVFLVLLG
jgi:hypothetical protein